MNVINTIGMGQSAKDLTQNHLDMINRCDVLIGGKRHLAQFDLPGTQKIEITSSIKNIVDTIKDKMDNYKIVVLASGDPLFYGIGSTLLNYFDKDQIDIHSNVSSVSAAFAAIKEPWHDAKIISLHGKQKQPFLFSTLAGENKIALLTDRQNTPQYIAGKLIEKGLKQFKFCVLENLGDEEKEKITWFAKLELVIKEEFSQPNIVILKNCHKADLVSNHICVSQHPEEQQPKHESIKASNLFSHIKNEGSKTHCNQETHIGMEDSLFQHSKGLITKSEIRSITLSKLKLTKKNHLLWDIGAGSGSLGIEAAIQIPDGYVYAIEKNSGRISDILSNIKKFNCTNIEVLNNTFPEGIDKIGNRPDRIFIGGGGKNLEYILNICCDKLVPSGIVVINSVLIQNFQASLKILKQLKFKPEAVQIQISRSRAMPFGDRFEALNPVWVISGTKPD